MRWMCILLLGISWAITQELKTYKEEVSFYNGKTRLAGTLILPKSSMPCAAIVVVHGSGASDRTNWIDQTQHFPSHGIALLRFDKRGVGDSSGDWRSVPMVTLADDVLAGVKFLSQRKEIDAKKIGVWGGSQGWTVASLAAARSKGSVAFAVIISGDPSGLWEQEKYRIRAMLSKNQVGKKNVDKVEHLIFLMEQYFRTGQNYHKIKKIAVSPNYKELLHYIVLGGVIPPENHPAVRYWRNNFAYKPLAIVPQIHCPVLSIWGEKDFLVDSHKAAYLALQAFSKSNDYIGKVWLNADHGLYYRKESGAGWAKDRNRFAPGVIDFMTSWVLEKIR